MNIIQCLLYSNIKKIVWKILIEKKILKIRDSNNNSNSNNSNSNNSNSNNSNSSNSNSNNSNNRD